MYALSRSKTSYSTTTKHQVLVLQFCNHQIVRKDILSTLEHVLEVEFVENPTLPITSSTLLKEKDTTRTLLMCIMCISKFIDMKTL